MERERVALGITCYSFAEGRAIRHRVLALLGIYVAITIFFGAVHYAVFLKQPDLYAFADNIKEGKLLEEFDSAYDGLLTRSKALYILALAHADLNRTLQARSRRVYFANPTRAQIESEKGFFTLRDHRRLRFRHDQLSNGRNLTHLYWVDVRDDNLSFSMSGDILAAIVVPSAKAAYHLHDADSPDEARVALEQLIEAVRRERTERLQEVRAQIEGRPDWNVFDFSYYSAVTITTLGYGDILPNSTIARLIVMLNAICGVFFAGFALLVLWPRGATGASE